MSDMTEKDKAREWRVIMKELRVQRTRGVTRFELTADELDDLLVDYAFHHGLALRLRLRTARIRLEVCAGRMEACNRKPQKHELMGEVRAWISDMKKLEIP